MGRGGKRTARSSSSHPGRLKRRGDRPVNVTRVCSRRLGLRRVVETPFAYVLADAVKQVARSGSYGSGVGADEVAYPPWVAVGWVEVLGSVYEPAELGSEALELADAAV